MDCRTAITVLLLLPTAQLCAHPVARSQHDRTVQVHLQAQADKLQVKVHFRLEVDELTVLLDDLAPFKDQLDLAQFRNKRDDLYREYLRLYSPIFAKNLRLTIAEQQVPLQCMSAKHQLVDDEGKPLGHLRCDLVFTAEKTLAPGRALALALREDNYNLQEGKIEVSLQSQPPLIISEKREASAALKKRAGTNDAQPGDEETLRRVSCYVELPPAPVTPALPAATPTPAPPPPPPVPTAPPRQPKEEERHQSGLLQLFLETDYGLVVLLLLSAWFGAAHALTPGHGKTLVAAYLVGERGTIWHAVFLGLVTTLTHTGVVLLLAGVLWYYSSSLTTADQASIQKGLGLGMGLVIACLGLWLLLRRLHGQADHIHLPGTGHHHHDHSHALVPSVAKPPVGWWRLLLLGITGGIIPCWDSVALLMYAVGKSLFWLALPMLLAFSAGLAGVLVLVGVLMVCARGSIQRLHTAVWERRLAILSAAAVTLMGFWLCYDSVHGVR